MHQAFRILSVASKPPTPLLSTALGHPYCERAVRTQRLSDSVVANDPLTPFAAVGGQGLAEAKLRPRLPVGGADPQVLQRLLQRGALAGNNFCVMLLMVLVVMVLA